MRLQLSDVIDIWEYRDVHIIDHRFLKPQPNQVRPIVNELVCMIYVHQHVKMIKILAL
jgi:hypothetical protein